MAKKKIDYRLAALWRFGAAITLVNILGHTVLGFEQSWAQPFVGVITAYVLEFVLETLSAWGGGRPLRYSGGLNNLLSFILPAHITGLAVPMLLYANDHLWPIALGVAIAIGSKYIFRVPGERGSRHFFNPSNTGIALVLILFPWVGIAPPYMFTENVAGAWDWLVPGVIILSGSYLNINFTKKMPLILAWLGGFFAQAVIRSLIFGTPIAAALMPMSGVAFLLFTFYMVSDPGTTPFDKRGQIGFGLAVAGVYSLLVSVHIVFGIFFSLIIVCTARGLALYVRSFAARRAAQTAPEVAQPAIARGS